MMKHVLVLFMFFPFLINAQGVQWEVDLSWEQLKEKAKKENRYIFIDCYATWCGPCKMMDKNVFSNDSVGKYFNKKFISVKVQMDKTEKDSEKTKRWYGYAEAFKKDFVIDAYPSLVFLSPQGKIIHKEVGYQAVAKLVSIGELVTQPGKTYEDPYAEYRQKVIDFNRGDIHFDLLPYMIKTAFKLQEADLARKMLKMHVEYSAKLPTRERYTKENIELWASFLLPRKSKVFGFFYQDADKIDLVMEQKGYADAIVLKTIRKEIVDSFFRMQEGETLTISGPVKNKDIMFMKLPVRQDGKIITNNLDANWKLLELMVRREFGNYWVKRTIIEAKIAWYRQLSNYTTATKYTLLKFRMYPPDLRTGKDYMTYLTMNKFAFDVFLYVHPSEKKIFNGVLKWVEKTIPHTPTSYAPLILDTYASLLYKVGKVGKAIMWQEKAIKIAEAENERRINIGKPPARRNSGWDPELLRKIAGQMKNGEKTHVDKGAIW